MFRSSAMQPSLKNVLTRITFLQKSSVFSSSSLKYFSTTPSVSFDKYFVTLEDLS